MTFEQYRQSHRHIEVIESVTQPSTTMYCRKCGASKIFTLFMLSTTYAPQDLLFDWALQHGHEIDFAYVEMAAR